MGGRQAKGEVRINAFVVPVRSDETNRRSITKLARETIAFELREPRRGRYVCAREQAATRRGGRMWRCSPKEPGAEALSKRMQLGEQLSSQAEDANAR